MNADQFNALYNVGVPVFAYPGARPEDIASATRIVTRTRSKASVLGGHTDVVWVDGHSACIALSHVDVVTEAEYEAAKLADAVAALEQTTTVRTDELRPGDRIWHPFDSVPFTVAHKPKAETGLHFEGAPGLRVTGTNTRGETVIVDVAAAYKWHRAPITDTEDAVREMGALPVPVGPEPQALPWAHAMSDDDLHGFLGDLVSAAMGRWQSDPEVPDRTVLAAVEKACAQWRTPGQGYRSDEADE